MLKLNKSQIAFVAALSACKLHQNNEVLVSMEADTDKPFSVDVFGAYIVAAKIKCDAPLFKGSDMDVPYYEGKMDECPASIITLLCLRDGDGSLAKPWKRGKNSYATLVDANDDGVPFDSIAKYIKANPENVFVDPNERAELDKKNIKVHVSKDKPKSTNKKTKATVTKLKPKAKVKANTKTKAKTKAAQKKHASKTKVNAKPEVKSKPKAKVKANDKPKAKVKSKTLDGGNGSASARQRLLDRVKGANKAKPSAVSGSDKPEKGGSKAKTTKKADKGSEVPSDLAQFMK